MTVLLRKEIRSLFPAWIVTMGATSLIAFVRPSIVPELMFVAGIGCLLLGITSFGSEFSQGTFSLLLAQPVPRKRIWWIKTITLGAALLSIAIMGAVSSACIGLESVGFMPVEELTFPAIFMLLLFGAAFAGGLFSALVTRQMATAFWIALLFPVALCGVIGILTADRSAKTIKISIAAALAAYDILAFWVARYQFLRAQDLPGASGTIVSLPAWLRFGAKARFSAKAPSHRPLRALIAKEFQLHQVSLCVAAVLLVLHVITVFIRRMIVIPGNSQRELYLALGCWWILWFVLPVMIAGAAVAEERRQGTLEGSLCLPARRSAQWLIKCLVSFFLAILFAGLMPWLLESAAQLMGNLAPIFEDESADHWRFLGWTVTVAAVMTLISFYASSLARSLLQAVGIAILVGSVFGWFVIEAVAVYSYNLQGDYSRFTDFLRPGLPAAFALLLWLSFTNFKHLAVGWRLWLENASVLLVVVFLVCGYVLFLQLTRYFYLPPLGGLTP